MQGPCDHIGLDEIPFVPSFSRPLRTLVLSSQLRVYFIQLWMQDILDPVIHLPAIDYQQIQRDRELFPKLREKSIQHWVIQNIIRVSWIKKCKICDDKGLTLPICSMNLVSQKKNSSPGFEDY